ncbi:uncharacterized protein A4U43_C03F1260 [Asparagus officinalis]|uniref:Uncharacterized protein n=1 Tax=Asparagus officinalis TaxID=4686 RepID=A0A5P1FBN8_ASPOF|nr:uncharacterized protein A4U43_C03F1260 [Asparagus officinalis]
MEESNTASEEVSTSYLHPCSLLQCFLRACLGCFGFCDPSSDCFGFCDPSSDNGKQDQDDGHTIQPRSRRPPRTKPNPGPGAADEEESQLGLDQEKGILEVRSRGPAPPGVKSPPGGKTN